VPVKKTRVEGVVEGEDGEGGLQGGMKRAISLEAKEDGGGAREKIKNSKTSQWTTARASKTRDVGGRCIQREKKTARSWGHSHTTDMTQTGKMNCGCTGFGGDSTEEKGFQKRLWDTAATGGLPTDQ